MLVAGFPLLKFIYIPIYRCKNKVVVTERRYGVNRPQ